MNSSFCVAIVKQEQSGCWCLCCVRVCNHPTVYVCAFVHYEQLLFVSSQPSESGFPLSVSLSLSFVCTHTERNQTCTHSRKRKKLTIGGGLRGCRGELGKSKLSCFFGSKLCSHLCLIIARDKAPTCWRPSPKENNIIIFTTNQFSGKQKNPLKIHTLYPSNVICISTLFNLRVYLSPSTL